MADLEYRTEEQRVLDNEQNINRPYTKGDPLKPRTEAERVFDADRAVQLNSRSGAQVGVGEFGRYPSQLASSTGLLTDRGTVLHPMTQQLVGVHAGPLPEPLALSATVAADKSDRRRIITAEEAANRIRDEFKPVEVEADQVRYTKFLTKVAHHLNADPNPANLKQIQDLLGKAEVELPDYDYPKMLYSRTLPDAGHGFETHIDNRLDHVGVIVNNKEDAGKLGSGWIEKPAELPARKEGEFGKFEEDKSKKPPAGTTPTTGYVSPVVSNPVKPVVSTTPVTATPSVPVTATPLVGPAGWDDISKTIKNSDGTPNIALSNAERAKRGIVPLNPIGA
jgi:hypothetical protein